MANFFVWVGLVALNASAQQMSPLECAWPKYAENISELDRVVVDMDSSMYCVNQTTGAWLKETTDELLKFKEGIDIVAVFEKRLRIIQDSYQYLKANCSKEENASIEFCKSFNSRILDSDWIKTVYFHTVIMLNDPEFLRSWMSNMPIYDVNKMIHTKRLQRSSFRFTLAEVAAGAPYVKFEILKILGDAGLLDLTADESFPLTYAISNHQLEKLKYLVSLGFDPNAYDSKPLEKYMSSEELLVAERQDGYTPLIRAIAYGNPDVLNYMLSIPNIDVNKGGEYDGATPLMIAINYGGFTGDSVPFYRLFSDPRVNINQQDRLGRTALNWLGLAGSPKPIVKRFINHRDFDFEVQCGRKNACLAEVINGKSLEKLKSYRPLFKKIDPSLRIYKFANMADMKVIEGLTVFEYIDQVILAEKNRIIKEKNPQKRAEALVQQKINIVELEKIKKYLLSHLRK